MVQLPIYQKSGIPLSQDLKPMSSIGIHEPTPNITTKITADRSPKTNDKPNLLIIEDNIDVTIFLNACLENNYQIETAQNGQEGIDKAIEQIPDIIISDIMMPQKDGLEVCATLKNEEKTSHIPIILLTAKADIASKLAGLEIGADAYLAKPFNEKELTIRLNQLITLRQNLQERYRKIINNGIELKRPITKEELFLKKVVAIIEENIDNTDFTVHHLYRAMGMGRTQLHNKLKALTNRSTSRFIRQIRLQKAKVLLTQKNLNVSEVAYKVGFNDPNYFSKVFIEEFGYPPSKNNPD